MKKTAFFLSILIWVLTNCQPPQIKREAKNFFDLKNILEKQIQELQQKLPTVRKKIMTNGKEETQNIRLKHWEKELKPFLRADINRPAWEDSYQTKDSTDKNGHWTIYTANNNNPSVRKLKILQHKGQLIEVHADIRDNNYLYTSSQKLSLYFAQNQLQTYIFSGEQRLFYGDYEQYVIKVDILKN